MEKYYQVYFDLLKGLSRQMETTIEDLPQESLDWMPGLDINSMAVLAAHTAGSTRFLIGDMAGGISSHRDRAAEFMTGNVSAQDLQNRLRETMVVCETVLDQLKLEDLHAARIHPRDGQEFTVAWCLGHALEHFAQHLGHMEITRQMWEIQNI